MYRPSPRNALRFQEGLDYEIRYEVFRFGESVGERVEFVLGRVLLTAITGRWNVSVDFRLGHARLDGGLNGCSEHGIGARRGQKYFLPLNIASWTLGAQSQRPRVYMRDQELSRRLLRSLLSCFLRPSRFYG